MHAVVLPIIAQTKAPIGWPDRYVHHYHWQGFIEFKGVATTLGRHQEQRIGQLNERSAGSAFIVRLEEGSTPSRWSGVITYVEDPHAAESKIIGHFTSGKELLSELRRLTAKIRRLEDASR